MKISVTGLVLGIVFAGIDIFLLVYLPGVTSQYLKGFGADVSGTLGSVFLSSTAIVLALALAILAIPIRAVKGAPKITGAAKLLQGLVIAAYYYVILNGGTVSLSLLYGNIDLVITATLLITLALLEVSALFRMLQGLFEMREHPIPPTGSAATLQAIRQP
ncbi:MAG TPA: hypothetical protein VIW22_00375 [Nitrososphaerales archaeon]